MAQFIFDSRLLNELITVEAPQNVDDEGGGYCVCWLEAFKAFTYVTPVRTGFSQELEVAQQRQAVQMLRIILRFHPLLDYTMRVIVKESIFAIVGITNLDHRNHWQEIIVCKNLEEV